MFVHTLGETWRVLSIQFTLTIQMDSLKLLINFMVITNMPIINIKAWPYKLERKEPSAQLSDVSNEQI